MTTATLTVPVRSNDGRQHMPGEAVTPGRPRPRSDFDPRLMIPVTFQDGSRGAVFAEEIAPND
jgi:hypothetical protein